MGPDAFERAFGTSSKAGCVKLPTNCMFAIPIEGLRPASYAKALYMQGKQSSSVERLSAAESASCGRESKNDARGACCLVGFCRRTFPNISGHTSLADPKLTQQRPLLRFQFPENFAEHAEENFGVRGAYFEPTKHAAKFFFGGGGGAAMDVAAGVESIEKNGGDAMD